MVSRPDAAWSGGHSRKGCGSAYIFQPPWVCRGCPIPTIVFEEVVCHLSPKWHTRGPGCLHASGMHLTSLNFFSHANHVLTIYTQLQWPNHHKVASSSRESNLPCQTIANSIFQVICAMSSFLYSWSRMQSISLSGHFDPPNFKRWEILFTHWQWDLQAGCKEGVALAFATCQKHAGGACLRSQ